MIADPSGRDTAKSFRYNCTDHYTYSLVQWNWFSDITECMQLRCNQWRQRTNFTAPSCTLASHLWCREQKSVFTMSDQRCITLIVTGQNWDAEMHGLGTSTANTPSTRSPSNSRHGQIKKKRPKWGTCVFHHWIQSSMEAILACHPAVSTEWLNDWTGWQFPVYYDVCARPPLQSCGLQTHSFVKTGHFWQPCRSELVDQETEPSQSSDHPAWMGRVRICCSSNKIASPVILWIGVGDKPRWLLVIPFKI